MPSPFVYWAQSETEIYLRVDVRDVSSHQIDIQDDLVDFSAVGLGGQGSSETNYRFVLEFFLPIDPAKSTYKVKEREVVVQIAKADAQWWPRLLDENAKLPWLKVDFDRWNPIERESDGEDDGPSAEELLKQRYPDVFKQLEKEEKGYITESRKKVYLFCYNLFMFCAFLYVFAVLALNYAKNGEEALKEAWLVLGNPVKMIHLLMFLEVLHPVFGYTPGGFVEPLIQVGGRNFVLLALIEGEERMQDKPVVFYLFLVYSLVELVRYPYYMMRVYGMDFGLLTYLRYTAWVPLYPAGFICEGVCFLRNIPYFEETGKFSVGLPNAWNFSFYFPNLLRGYLLFFFFPMLYTMMNHMYHLRCKKLKIKQHARNRKKKHDE